MVPLFLMGFACFFLALWTVPYLGLIGIPLWFLMYRMSKKDDFVFRQIGLYLKLTLPASANKKIWGNCISLSPSAESKAVSRILLATTSQLSNRELRKASREAEEAKPSEAFRHP